MKRNFKNINDDLLVKYLLGEATPEENLLVQHWVEASAENHRHFEHFRIIWEESRKLAAVSTVREDEAWQRFRQRVSARPETEARVIKMQPTFPWLRVAAVVAVLLAAGGLWFLLAGNQSRELTLAAGDTVRNDTLPDGSIVTLNKHAVVSYPATFKGTREVKLEGEAFFDIAANPEKPFIITANDVTIRVVGTSFNVKSSPGKTEVIVETGAVEVSKDKHTLQVRLNEKVVVTGEKAELVKQTNTDDLYSYYRTKSFNCNETPLWKLVATLSEAYNTDIVIGNEQLRNLPLTTTFTDSSLDEILNVISKTFNISIEKNGKQIILK